MGKIVILIPYFGRLPNIFTAFLDSCRLNPSIDFILFADDDTTIFHIPANVKVIISSLSCVRSLCPEEVRNGLRSPYKLCDYKPLYGVIFADYIEGYDFWGYCDIDFIFGKFEKYLSTIDLNYYDRLFDLGHLTLYRNNSQINNLWRNPYSGQKKTDSNSFVFNTSLSCNFDECHMNKVSEEFLDERWLRSDLFPYIDIDWKYPFFRSGDLSVPQLFVHYPDGKLFRFSKHGNDIKKSEFFYIHMLRRPFPDIDTKIFSSAYLITHIGILPFQEEKLLDYFDKFSMPTNEDMFRREHYFEHSLLATKKQKFVQEIRLWGIKGLVNIVNKIVYDHIL